jgi:iron complex transport system substrate-binding protein
MTRSSRPTYVEADTWRLGRRGLLGIMGAGLAGLAVSGCSNSALDTPAEGAATTAGSGFPVTVTHRFGQTTVPSPPQRIVALGQTDCDPLIALGVTPVAIGSFMQGWYDPVHPWNEKGFPNGKPTEVNFSEIQFEKILELKPDLITMASGGITKSDYAKLSKIAPVVGPPVGYQDYAVPYGPHTLLIGQVVGKETEAKAVVAAVDAKFKKVRDRHPEWRRLHAMDAESYTGKFDVLGKNAPRTTYLTSMGFSLSPQLIKEAGSNYQLDISAEELGPLVGDLDLVVWNTDPGTISKLQKNPVVAASRSTQDGHAIWINYAKTCHFMWAMDWGTVLSSAYAIEIGEPLIEAALAGKSPVAPGAD